MSIATKATFLSSMHASLENVEIKVLLYQSKNLQTVILTFIWSKIAVQWWQHEIKSGGGGGEAEKKIGHSNPPPKTKKRHLPYFFVTRRQHLSIPGIRIMEYWEWATNILDQYYLKGCQQQKLHRIAFHRPVVEGGSAD